MALSCAERAARYRARLGREEVNRRARAFYQRHRDRLRRKRMRSEFRAKRARYMRVYNMADRMLDAWMKEWAA